MFPLKRIKHISVSVVQLHSTVFFHCRRNLVCVTLYQRRAVLSPVSVLRHSIVTHALLRLSLVAKMMLQSITCRVYVCTPTVEQKRITWIICETLPTVLNSCACFWVLWHIWHAMKTVQPPHTHFNTTIKPLPKRWSFFSWLCVDPFVLWAPALLCVDATDLTGCFSFFTVMGDVQMESKVWSITMKTK